MSVFYNAHTIVKCLITTRTEIYNNLWMKPILIKLPKYDASANYRSHFHHNNIFYIWDDDMRKNLVKHQI